jgi:hypothetical protein
MCYRCEVCQEVSQPKEKRNLWSVPRTRVLQNPAGKTIFTPHNEIAYEVATCNSCFALLVAGMDLAILKKCHGKPIRVPSGIRSAPITPPVEVDEGEDPPERLPPVVARCDVCGSTERVELVEGKVLCEKHSNEVSTRKNNKKKKK